MSFESSKAAKTLLTRALGLPPDDCDGVVQYLKTLDRDAFVEYLQTLLGVEFTGRIADLASIWFPGKQVIGGKKKVAQSGKTKDSPSRQMCQCMASAEHGLFTNCTECGKVLCGQEGPGPCTSCGVFIDADGKIASIAKKQPQPKKNGKSSYVAFSSSYRGKVDPSATISSTSSAGKETVKLGASFPKLTAAQNSSSASTALSTQMNELKKAEEYRDRLLQYDKTDASRTRVQDISEDFQSTQSNQWLTPAERALAKKEQQEYERLLEEQRRRIHVSLDLVGQRLIEANPTEIKAPILPVGASREKPKSEVFVNPHVYLDEGPVEFIRTDDSLVQKIPSGSARYVRSKVIDRFEDELILYGGGDGSPSLENLNDD